MVAYSVKLGGCGKSRIRTGFPKRKGTKMALRKCEDCGKMVSTAAESCPFCGRPFVAVRKSNEFNPWHDPVHFVGGLLAVILIIFIIVMIVGALVSAMH